MPESYGCTECGAEERNFVSASEIDDVTRLPLCWECARSPRPHPSYMVAFAAWSALLLVSLFLLVAGWTGPVWYWPSIWAAFLAIELPGAAGSKRSVKTFSGLVWAAMHEAPARRTWGYGLAVTLGDLVIALPFIMRGTIYDVPWVVLVYVPLIALGVAVLGWLWDHFPNFGRNG